MLTAPRAFYLPVFPERMPMRAVDITHPRLWLQKLGSHWDPAVNRGGTSHPDLSCSDASGDQLISRKLAIPVSNPTGVNIDIDILYIYGCKPWI